jgi:hypothetical protein
MGALYLDLPARRRIVLQALARACQPFAFGLSREAVITTSGISEVVSDK